MGISDDAKKKMQGALEHLKTELKGIRTGRANPAMLDNIVVEIYGANMRIKELGTISSPEPQQLAITVFDPQTVHSIAKAITASNIGFQPRVEGNLIRILVPPMDENVRKQMVKICKEKREECKIGIRNVRRDFNDLARKEKTAGKLTEDELKHIEKEIQNLTDRFCKDSDDITATKENEVLSI